MFRIRLYLLLTFLLSATLLEAQHLLSVTVQDAVSKEKLSGVSVTLEKSRTGGMTDSTGQLRLGNIPAGAHTLHISLIGYRELIITYTFPLANPVIVLEMEKEAEKMEEVIISSSRTDSRIENTPTRVEVLGAEEVEEESGVKPGNIASLLGDVAGIQSQQTSAVTGNTDLRIQGLPGDYTQLLRDGMPLFGGYAGSFSVLHIPPLDLKQIEIIKGASSTLYGGGAIAGMINIISKKPKLNEQERYLLLNQSSLYESNVNIYLSDREKKRGYTFFAGGTYQKQIDVNKDEFSDVPQFENIFLHPTFFIYPSASSTLSIGLNSTFEDRRGGDMRVIRNQVDSLHRFYVQNRSYRNTLDAVWEKKINLSDKFTLKGTASWYYRNITTNVFGMKAKQLSFYTEGSWVRKKPKHDWVTGFNINGEHFKKKTPDSSLISNYDYVTLGFFLQDDWRLHPKFTLESGLRTDIHDRYGTFILPRLSLLYKISAAVTSRIGGGLGYKIPTLFNSEVDERDFGKLRFDNTGTIKAEKSAGVNWDFNFRKKTGQAVLTINQSFYITRISRPLVADTQQGLIVYYTASRPVVTKGFETWVQITYHGLEAYLGYTLTDAHRNYDPLLPHLPLSAKNKFASVISYEFSPRFRACIEAAYTGRQYLDDGSLSPSFPFIAGMIRYDIGRFSFVLNVENLLDYRQTRKENILIPPLTNPRFKQIWGPIDGRAVNLSMRIKF